MMSEPRLYQSIAAEIVALIEKGEFPPGSRLPANATWPNASASAG